VGSERVAVFWDEMVAALTSPLTPEEQETGMYVPPPDPRLCFTGTLLDAQEFYQKTTPQFSCKNCPIAQWTDGLPVVIPTEEKVKAMLTGTSHAPEEYIAYVTDQRVTFSTSGVSKSVKAGSPVMMLPNTWGVTVEKTAVNCVMAGCTNPKSLPVILAAYQTGTPFVTTSCPTSHGIGIYGPIAEELGLNNVTPYSVGNPAAETIGRAFDLFFINVGGAAQGTTNTNLGHPSNRVGLVCAEDVSALPPGWVPNHVGVSVTPYGSQGTVTTTENNSIVRVFGAAASGMSYAVSNFSAEAFRGLNKGEGPIARNLGVEGKPGKYNIMLYFVPNLTVAINGGLPATIIMSPEIAQSLYDFGFKTKGAVTAGTFHYTALFYKQMGWWDFATTGGTNSVAGMTYGTLPDSYMLSRGGSFTIVVSNSIGDPCMVFCPGAGGSAKLIDAWY